MIRKSIIPTVRGKAVTWLAVAAATTTSAVLGVRASQLWLVLLLAGMAAVALMSHPQLGLAALIAVALGASKVIRTGTQVQLNAATLLMPVLGALWIVDGLRHRDLRWASSPVNRPLTLFLLAGIVSLLLGNVLWDPAVPKSANFWLVQLAQWAIFALSALAFWLAANLREARAWLPRITWVFLVLGGGLAVLRVMPGVGGFIRVLTTQAFIRAPFWVLLTALGGGQLLFNRELRRATRLFLGAVCIAAFVYAFIEQRETVSNWVGVSTVAAILIWLRAPRLRTAIIVVATVLALTGVLFPGLYEFAGGQDEWDESGGARLVLIERVVRVTLRNPITGLGPTSYRPYADIEPLKYNRAVWFHPQVNSHNNYIDLFAHTGLLGLGLFLWFATELGILGARLVRRFQRGFDSGFAAGMFAAWIASLVIMLLADWMLPFVYNISFGGFQASVLVWLFLGALVQMSQPAYVAESPDPGAAEC